jgi:hypothetical protein
MPNTDQIRPLTEVPDHGHGLLGRLAHSVLAEYAGLALAAPRLHLGQNTLPDPPFPMAAQVPFGDLTEGWREAGEDLGTFLELGARTLREQPTPDVSCYTQQVRLLQSVLRFDSIALAWQARLLGPADGVAAWVVDRAGNALAGLVLADDTVPAEDTVQADGTVQAEDRAAGIVVSADLLNPDDQVIRLLRDVLDAQYAWTKAVFGISP